MTKEYKKEVRDALVKDCEKRGVSEAKYSASIGVSASIFSRIKNGDVDNVAAKGFWVEQGMRLGILNKHKQLKIARTAVYTEIEHNIKFCNEHKKAVIIIDEPGIGKTRCAKHVLNSDIDNGYYFDCSQYRTIGQFVKNLAKTLGVDPRGKVFEVKERIKYFINNIQPTIVLDDGGYVESNVFIEVISLWNATEGQCGWIMMGDKSLESKIQRGIDRNKPGYDAFFSRFSGEFIKLVPGGKAARQNYLTQVLGDIAAVNVKNSASINKMIKTCLVKDQTVRQLHTLIALEAKKN